MEIHVFCVGLVVVGVLCALTVGIIWLIFTMTEGESFEAVLSRNAELDEMLNEELAANQRLLAQGKAPGVVMRSDEVEIAPGVM